MAIVAKRTIMSLFSDIDDVYSHQVRIVLAEKRELMLKFFPPNKMNQVPLDLLA